MQEVTQVNVPVTTESNLCRMAPQLPLQCTWKQGMLLLGLKGSDHGDLYVEAPLRYRDSVVAAQEGVGLFVRWGNPLYYTMKGTADDVAKAVHSVLRGSLDDLGGHHMVLKVARDPDTLQPYMYVHRIPLAGNMDYDGIRSGVDPIELAYAWSTLSTKQSGGNHGWLSNLAGDMISEKEMVDRLYPLPSATAAAGGNMWNCPLLRVAFWSQVVENFSPLIPSPVRAARLFGSSSGKHMLPGEGIRSHPTQVLTFSPCEHSTTATHTCLLRCSSSQACTPAWPT